LLVIFVGAAETGFRLALRRTTETSDRDAAEITTIQAAVLGLLALLLGFTFSMAASRFEARKELVRDEANAIGAAWLRAQLLPEPQQANAARLLRRYVDTRFELQDASRAPDALGGVHARTGEIQNQLWVEAMAAAERDPRSVMTGLFVQSLNDMIDMHGKQMAAVRNRIPGSIFALLCFVAVVAVGLTGYGSGAARKRNFVLTLVVSLLVTAVITLIVDLHRPTRGFITVDQQNMIDTRDSMGGRAR
jgi:hypothetical protein